MADYTKLERLQDAVREARDAGWTRQDVLEQVEEALRPEEVPVPEVLYIVRHWDGFDGEWIDIGEPMTKELAEKEAGDRNEKRVGSGAGNRRGNYNEIDYFKAFPADTKMHFSEGLSQTRG